MTNEWHLYGILVTFIVDMHTMAATPWEVAFRETIHSENHLPPTTLVGMSLSPFSEISSC